MSAWRPGWRSVRAMTRRTNATCGYASLTTRTGSRWRSRALVARSDDRDLRSVAATVDENIAHRNDREQQHEQQQPRIVRVQHGLDRKRNRLLERGDLVLMAAAKCRIGRDLH